MRRLTGVLAAAVLAVAMSGCSQAKADPESAAWSLGCAALDTGLRANGIKRDTQTGVLNRIVDTGHLPAAQRAWARQAVSLLQYDDVRRAPAPLRRAAGAPCTTHGHRVKSLG